MGVIVSVSGQKGGCGKSSITVILASYLAYNRKKKVLVLDADTYQKSLITCRQDDIDIIKMGKEAKETSNSIGDRALIDIYEAYVENKRNGIEPYPIIALPLKVDEILSAFEKYVDEYDVILVDMPGSLDNKDYFKVARNFDVIFLPFSSDSFVFNSNYPFIRYMHDKYLGNEEKSRIKHIYWFWNRYDKSTRQSVYSAVSDLMKENLPNVESLDNALGDTKAMSNQKMRNTMTTPIGKFASYGNCENCMQEMCDKILNL